MMKKDTFHMSPEEFRKHGHAVVDWIAEYMKRLNTSGKLFLTHAKLNNKIYLRMAIAQTYTKRQHVVKAWKLIRQYSSRVFIKKK